MAQADELATVAGLLLAFVENLAGREMEGFGFQPLVSTGSTCCQLSGHGLGIAHIINVAHGERRLLQVTLMVIAFVLIREVTVTRHVGSHRECFSVGIGEIEITLHVTLIRTLVDACPVELLASDHAILIEEILHVAVIAGVNSEVALQSL